MFDPSFFELIVICIVALLVLGPDKLPGAIKTLGLWIGRLRRSFNSIKREIEQEVGADEIRRQLRNEAIMEKFNSTKSQITQSIDSVKNEAESIKNDLNLSKELSGVTGESSGSDSAGEDADGFDPVEKLPTSDPAARIIPPDNKSDTGNNDQQKKTTEADAPKKTEAPTPSNQKDLETDNPDKTKK